MKAGGFTDLRRTQELFWTLITAPEGVRPAIEDLGRTPSGAVKIGRAHV